MKYPAIVSSIISITLLVGVGCAPEPSAPTPSPTTPPSTTSGVYESKTLGIKFSYPTDLFKVTESSGRVVVESPYHVIENYKGTPDGEFKHPFAITFLVRNMDMVSAMDEDLPAFKDAYEQGMRGEDVSNFMLPVTAASATGVKFIVGIEGTNRIYAYLPRGPKDTVVIEMTYITDFLKDAIKPKPIAEQAQLDAFYSVVDSLEFVK